MECATSYKSYLYWGDDSSKPEVRRFYMDEAKSSKIAPLQDMLRDIYQLKSQKFSIAWKDEDGDEVLMSSDGEVRTMVSECQEGVLKLIVRCNGQKGDEAPDAPALTAANIATTFGKLDEIADILHQGVNCNACGRSVTGHRYKCITCDNYDLCALCETAGKHPEHCVVRVPLPNMPIPLIKASIKKSRRFLKSFASQALEESKRHRRERKHASEHKTQGKQDSQPRFTQNWVEVFGKYLEEFANLAGDFNRSSENNTTAAETAATTEPGPSTGTSNGAVPKKVPTYEEIELPWGFPQDHLDKFQHVCDTAVSVTTKAYDKIFELAASVAEEATAQFPPQTDSPVRETSSNASHEVTKEEIEKEIFGQPQAAYEEAVKPEANPTPQESPMNRQGVVAQIESVTTQAQMTDLSKMAQNDIMKITISGQGTPESTGLREIYVKRCDISELVNAVSKNEMSSNSSSCSSESHGSDRAEGWTVIDPESAIKDENPDYFSANMQDPSGNIQQRARYQAPLYPPLNVATAVLDPKEAEVAATAPPKPAATAPPKFAATAPPKPAATAPPKPAATAPPKAAPKQNEQTSEKVAQAAAAAEARKQLAPHVEAAVRQMEAMGFSNESGWLTQLLDHNDGNIATVLDLITPNTPK